MGQIYKVCCPDCGHSFEFSQGCGRFDCTAVGRERHKQKILTGAFGEKLKKILEEHPDALVSYSKELLYCDKCNRYENQSVYRIYKKSRSGKSNVLPITSEYACIKCHKPMEIIGGRDSDYFVAPLNLVCPRCKGLARISTVLCFD